MAAEYRSGQKAADRRGAYRDRSRRTREYFRRAMSANTVAICGTRVALNVNAAGGISQRQVSYSDLTGSCSVTEYTDLHILVTVKSL